MAVDMFIFMLLAMNYKYAEPAEDVEEGDKPDSAPDPSIPPTTPRMPPPVVPHQAYTVIPSLQQQQQPQLSSPENSNLAPNLLTYSSGPEETAQRFSLASMFNTNNNRRRSTQNGISNQACDNNEQQ